MMQPRLSGFSEVKRVENVCVPGRSDHRNHGVHDETPPKPYDYIHPHPKILRKKAVNINIYDSSNTIKTQVLKRVNERIESQQNTRNDEADTDDNVLGIDYYDPDYDIATDINDEVNELVHSSVKQYESKITFDKNHKYSDIVEPLRLYSTDDTKPNIYKDSTGTLIQRYDHVQKFYDDKVKQTLAQEEKKLQLHERAQAVYSTFLSDTIGLCKQRASECTSTEELIMHRALSQVIKELCFTPTRINVVVTQMVEAVKEAEFKGTNG